MSGGARKPAHDSRGDGDLRLLSYARVSAVRGREGPGFISERDQFSRNRSYADAYGHEIVDEGSDLDISGGAMSRPTFDRFLTMIERGEADGIIVAKLDRFARSNVGALAAVESIEGAGGTLISVSEQLDASTGAGRFLRTILFAAAQWERERIGEAWHTARSSAVERGIHVSHHVPPGYVRGPRTNDKTTDRRLTPHPAHAETIGETFKMARAGASNQKLADFLNKRRLPVISIKRGEQSTNWQSFRVPRLLANRVYLGEARSGDSIVKKNAHEALVDEDTWLLAQRSGQAAQGPRRPNRNAKVAPSVLSGILRCAGCSFAMKPQGAGKASRPIYRCVTASVAMERCPSPSTIAKQRIEDYVIEQFVASADAYFVGTRGDDGRRRQLDADATAAERSYRTALTNVELRAKIGDDDHDRLIAALFDEWQTKLTAARKAQSRVPLSEVVPPAGVSLREFVERLRAEGENEKLRSLLASGIEAVFVRAAQSRARNLPVADRVKIIWRGDEVLDLPRRGRRFEPRPYIW
jgi:DNA invertase Pin-like site-specific DNA recombinase